MVKIGLIPKQEPGVSSVFFALGGRLQVLGPACALFPSHKQGIRSELKQPAIKQMPICHASAPRGVLTRCVFPRWLLFLKV